MAVQWLKYYSYEFACAVPPPDCIGSISVTVYVADVTIHIL